MGMEGLWGAKEIFVAGASLPSGREPRPTTPP